MTEINKYNNNVYKVNVGQVFKNYKELCKYLNQPCLGGSSKQSQIKEWKRHFDYEKDGNKIRITNVFEEPSEKNDKRVFNGTELYTKFIENILLKYIDATLIDDNKPYEFNLQQMVLMFGMANPIYYQENIRQYLLNIGYAQFHINDFYNRSGNKFISIIENALNNMEKRKIIIWNKRNKIKQDGCWRTATNIEANQIVTVEKEVLYQMGYKSVPSVICAGQGYNYFTKVKIKLHQLYQYEGVYKFYEIWCARKRIEIEKMCSDKDSDYLRFELNDRVINALKQQVVDKACKNDDALMNIYLYDNHSETFVLPSDYVETQNELTEYLLRIVEKSIDK